LAFWADLPIGRLPVRIEGDLDRHCVDSHSLRDSFGVVTESTEGPVVEVAAIETSCCWVLDEL
jgi:hypothetical protein